MSHVQLLLSCIEPLLSAWTTPADGVGAVVANVSLAAELDLLLHLVALPPGIDSAAGMPPDTRPMFTTGAVAALYASRVLCLSGQLLPW